MEFSRKLLFFFIYFLMDKTKMEKNWSGKNLEKKIDEKHIKGWK